MNSAKSDKSLRHELASKDPFCCLCLTGTVVKSWSLPQEVVGSSNLFYKTIGIGFSKYSENFQEKFNCLNTES